MKRFLLTLLLLAALVAPAQSILSVTPARRTPVWNGFTYSTGVCVVTAVDGTYVVSVATSVAGPYRDRLTFQARGEPVSCYRVPLTVAETNQFFVRARRL